MYQSTGKTIKQVIQETKLLMEKKEVTHHLNTKHYYFKKFKDCTSILTSNRNSGYYVGCLFDLYGSFTSVKQANQFRELIRMNQEAHQQAMWKSWEQDPVVS